VPTRNVIIHRCRPEFDTGVPFNCKCSERICRRDAWALVERGRAYWKQAKQVSGGTTNLHTEIILKERQPMNSRTISATDIENAYIKNQEYDQKRIKAFGESEGRSREEDVI
jgi:hypothetical protein